MNVLLAKEDGDKIGIISLLNQPIGERDVGTLALAVGILVAVDFLWEMSTDIVEHALIAYGHEHIHDMLEKLYKGTSCQWNKAPRRGEGPILTARPELTIVGIWAIILFVLTVYVPVDSAGFKHFFELVHVSLFGLTLFYIATCVFIAIVSQVIFRVWSVFEGRGQKNATESFLAVRKGIRWYYWLNPHHTWKMIQTSIEYHYFEIRHHFIEHFELSSDFEFDEYLELCVKHLYTELAQVHWSCLFFVLLVELTVWIAITLVTNNNIGITYTVFAAIALGGQFCLFLKINEVFATVAHEGSDIIKPARSSEAGVTMDQRRRKAEAGFDVEGHHLAELEMTREQSLDIEKGVIRREDSTTSDPTETERTHGARRLFRSINFSRQRMTKAFGIEPEPSPMKPVGSLGILDPKLSDSSESEEEQEGEWSSYVSSSSWVTYGSEVESGSEITMGGDATDTPARGQKFIHHHHHHVHHHHHNEHDPHHRHHRHIKRHKLHHHTQIDLVFITSFLIPLLRCQITPRKIYRFFFVASPHQELFWLNAPALYLYLVQLMLLFNVSLGVFAAVALSGLLKVPWEYQPFMLTVLFINFIFFIPIIIYQYSLIMNVGEYSKERLIAIVTSEHRSKNKKKHQYHHRVHKTHSKGDVSEASEQQKASSKGSDKKEKKKKGEPDRQYFTSSAFLRSSAAVQRGSDVVDVDAHQRTSFERSTHSSERRSFDGPHSGGRRSFEESFSGGERRSLDERFSGGERRSLDERFSGGERRSLDERFSGGERRSFDGPQSSDHRSMSSCYGDSGGEGDTESEGNVDTPRRKKLPRHKRNRRQTSFIDLRDRQDLLDRKIHRERHHHHHHVHHHH